MDADKQTPEPSDAMAADWKKTLADRFRLWLEELDTDPDLPAEREDEPDLYSFYEELCVLRNEFSKNARRSHDSFARFSETLAALDGVLQAMLGKVDREAHQRQAAEQLENMQRYLPLVELFERFKRIQQKLNAPPAKGFWGVGKKQHVQWERLREGFEILKSHFEQLLKSQGVSRIETRGAAFDPTRMTAVAVQETTDIEPDMVLEEISGGYLLRGQVLKMAEVRISRNKGAQT